MPSTTLSGSDDELRKKFLALTTRVSVAQLLDVPLKQLTYHLYIVNDSKRYTKFTAAKKSGGIREIQAPATALKIIQRKLNQVLQTVYEIRKPVHGFVNDRSVVTNARLHVGARFILNIDLKDFFPSINFGRVQGTFMARPYRIPNEAATVLAQICCFKKCLPQGAPTSPIVSNMVCATLDAQMQKLAQRYNCLYSRYADDITFSTGVKTFPKSLARTIAGHTGTEVVIGAELASALKTSGFEVNPRKTRLQTTSSRQEITGITINEFPNVTRKYLKGIRAMIHAWDKFGLDLAELEFRNQDKKHRNPKTPPPSFKRVLKGKLDFLTMVRGKGDSVCIRLLRDYARLDPAFKFTAPIGPRTSIELAKDAV